MTRDDVVEVARSWLGTPYRNQASAKGRGADCLGVLRGVYAEVCRSPAETPPPYGPYWYTKGEQDLMLQKAREYLIEKEGTPEPGDVLVFRMRKGCPAKHCGILTYEGHMIHALTGKDVEEVPVSPSMWEKVAGVFSFPERKE